MFHVFLWRRSGSSRSALRAPGWPISREPASREFARSILLDDEGNTVSVAAIEGYFTVVKLSAVDGKIIWKYEVPGHGLDAAFTASGDVIAVGIANREDRLGLPYIVRLSGDTGTPTWQKRIGDRYGYSKLQRVVVDINGNVWVGGYLNGGAHVIRLTVVGDILWQKRLSEGEVIDLSLDGQGALVAAGRALLNRGFTIMSAVWSLDAARVDGNTGGIYVAGTFNNQLGAARFAGPDGRRIWSRRIGAKGWGLAVAVDLERLVVGGARFVNLSNTEFGHTVVSYHARTGHDWCVGSGNDTDGDGHVDVCDSCPGQWNAYQRDFDGDRVGDACDNCVLTYNPRAGELGFRRHHATQTNTGGQRDGDADGFGNACDGDFNNSGGPVDAVDAALLDRARNQRTSQCRVFRETGAYESCDQFDLDGFGPYIDPGDDRVFRLLEGREPGPKCGECPLP